MDASSLPTNLGGDCRVPQAGILWEQKKKSFEDVSKPWKIKLFSWIPFLKLRVDTGGYERRLAHAYIARYRWLRSERRLTHELTDSIPEIASRYSSLRTELRLLRARSRYPVKKTIVFPLQTSARNKVAFIESCLLPTKIGGDTPVSLGYPLSVFNKNSTLKEELSSREDRPTRRLQRVPWKMRLKMEIGMQIELPNGIKKLPFYGSFQIFTWKET